MINSSNLKVLNSLILFFLFNLSLTYSQSIDYKLISGEKFQLIKNYTLKKSIDNNFSYKQTPRAEIILATIDKIYLSSRINKSKSIHVFDKTLNQSKKVELDLPNAEIIEIFYLNGEINLLYAKKDAANEQQLIFHSTINKETFEISEKKQIGIVEKKGNVSEKTLNTYLIQYSPDSSKICLRVENLYGRIQNAGVNFMVFDTKKNYQKLVHQVVPLKYKDPREIILPREKLDNNGNVYIIKLARFKAYDVYDNPIQEKSLIQLSASGTEVLIQNIQYEDGRFVPSLFIKENKLLLMGFFVNQEGQPIGWKVSEIELNTKKIIDHPMVSLDESNVKKLFNAKYWSRSMNKVGNKPAIALDKFSTIGIIQNANDGYYHISQKSYSSNSADGSSTSHKHDVLITSLNSEFKVNWVQRIPKYQAYSFNMDILQWAGIHFKLINSTIYLLHNDNIKNKDYTGEKNPKNFSLKDNYALVISKVTENGELSQEYITDPNLKAQLPYINSIYSNSENEFLLFGKKAGNGRISKISID